MPVIEQGIENHEAIFRTQMEIKKEEELILICPLNCGRLLSGKRGRSSGVLSS
jgi:hypothetical protein